MISIIFLTVLWFIVWTLFAWPADARHIIIGVPASIFVALMTREMLIKRLRPFRNPMRYLWFIYYMVVFAWECLKANIDVAYRVLHPDLPIRPGTIKVKIHLRSNGGLTFLANSITLTPGTTCVDIDKNEGVMYVHWIYVKEGYDTSSMKLDIVNKFENILKRIFD
ncbi:MAG: Na+/H+ antiporter subunit E [Candidatus Omnitrophota bacterium]|jgi:multicomponent Na+:H+ antiporter subunit E